MKIETADFGIQEIDPETTIEFPKGIPGFEGNREFKFFHEEGAGQVHYLQSTEQKALAFSVIDPATVNIFYQIRLDDDELRTLQCNSPEQVGILVLAYRQKPGDSEQSKALSFSFMSPLIINFDKRRGLMKPLTQAQKAITISAE